MRAAALIIIAGKFSFKCILGCSFLYGVGRLFLMVSNIYTHVAFVCCNVITAKIAKFNIGNNIKANVLL